MEPTGTIREYKPTWRERAANALADLVEGMGADRWKANKIAQTLLGGERSNLPAGMGLSDLASLGVVPGAPAALRAASVPAGLLNYADASKEGNPFSALTVWHGSPHKFDKFDSANIGRGEGAQAYGHGLYLAESPGVAKSYQVTLSGRGDAAGAAAKYAPARQFNAEELAAIHRAATGDDPINLAARRLGYRQASLRDVDEAALTKAIADVREQAGGYLYKVDLPDNLIARMLDWDKPLSQQAPEVQKAFDPMVAPIRAEMAKPANPGWGDLAAPTNFDPSGQELLGLLRNRDAQMTAQHFLSNGLGPNISSNLRSNGIPGIRYLDGSSRGAGQGTYNYVVFPGEENALTILERNGNPIQRLVR